MVKNPLTNEHLFCISVGKSFDAYGRTRPCENFVYIIPEEYQDMIFVVMLSDTNI